MKILNEHQEELLKSLRGALHELSLILAEFSARKEDQVTLSDSIKKIDELFLLVVVGEFNSGKSAFINAFLGQKFLEEGVTPTTTQINVIRYGEKQETTHQSEKERTLRLPVVWLNEINIVDTPGTNAIIRDHEKITTEFIPQSDLVLFITSADRPFTESERIFLENIQKWGKKIVVIINKIDILKNEMELDQIRKFVIENVNKLLDFIPDVFPVSSREAIEGKHGDLAKWENSKFEELEKFINNKLDEKERIKLKFLNPIGVGIHLADKYLGDLEKQLNSLQEDIQLVSDVEGQLVVYEDDMQRDFEYRMADIDNELLEMERRGDEFFENTFRIARVLDLLNRDRIKIEFEKQVIGDVPQEIEKKVNKMIDWLVDSELQQWQAVNDHLVERRKSYKERIVGNNGFSNISYERDRLIDTISRNAQQVINSYDKDREAKSIAEEAQLAVAASAALEIGAIGLGTLVAILASSAAVDITGILLASLVAVLGFIVIPARRKTAKTELHNKVSELRENLIDTMRDQFISEIRKSVQKIVNEITPYSRFVKAESARLSSIQSELTEIKNQIKRISINIEDL